MKKLILLLALLSLPTAWAMDWDERKDDDLRLQAPDYSQDSEVAVEYFTPEQALAELQKETSYEDPLACVIRDDISLPKDIAHLIAQYVRERKAVTNGDYFDSLIDDTPLYFTHHDTFDGDDNQKMLKAQFYQDLKQSLSSKQSMTFSDVLEHCDKTWNSMLQTKPFLTYDKGNAGRWYEDEGRVRGWKVSEDKKRIVTYFLTKSKSNKLRDCGCWYIMVYDIENNSIIHLTKLPKSDLIAEDLTLCPNGSFTIRDKNELKENNPEDPAFLIWSKYPVITYHPDSNTVTSTANFLKIKTVHSEYNHQEENFVQTRVVVETPDLSSF